MSTELVLTLIKQEVLILAMLIKSILQVKKKVNGNILETYK